MRTRAFSSEPLFLASLSVLALWGCGIDGDATAFASSPRPELEATTSTENELGSSPSARWFSLEEGNTWSFLSVDGSAERTVTMTQVRDDIGLLEGLFGAGQWVHAPPRATGALQILNAQTRAWQPFLRFAGADRPWQFSLSGGPCDTYEARRTATGVVSRVPAGRFTGGRRFALSVVGAPNVRCHGPVLTELTFHPSVGLVSFRDGANVQYQLAGATVGGTAYPQHPASDVRGEARLDRRTYTNTTNTIRCIRAPCPDNAVTAWAKLTYVVTNRGAQPATYQFSSGCQTRVRVLDATGAVVKDLERSRMCTMALTTLTLAPGAARTYSDRIELVSDSGEQLSGDYTVKVSLRTEEAELSVAETTVGFAVTQR
jgi:hypothetical protein